MLNGKKKGSEKHRLFNQLRGLSTEQRNPRSMDIDGEQVLDILKIINSEDRRVAHVVRKEIPYIAKAVDLVIDALRKGGRLIYVGAGTSGRLGILDAAECPPTYGTDPNMIQGLIAGGKRAVFRSIEGAEDRAAEGRQAIDKKRVTERDIVCGIAASRRTPFVVAAVERARERGARTIYITTNPRSDFHLDVDVAICPAVGPEVIMGSTRMKSGTAQKLVLNMITTTAMIRKLEERANRVLMIVTGVNYQTAEKALRGAGGHVKTAIVMIKAKVNAREARRRLKEAHGFVRAAIEGKSLAADRTINHTRM
jgi:N-acetylmuramic acid 6-phosphate etherase